MDNSNPPNNPKHPTQKTNPFTAGLHEPSAKFPVADAFIFLTHLVTDNVKKQGIDKEWQLSSDEMALISLIIAQYSVSAGSKTLLTHLKNKGVKTIGKIDLDDLEHVPVMTIGILHLPLSAIFFTADKPLLGTMALCWALGNNFLGLPKHVIEKFGKKLDLIQGKDGETYKKLTHTFGNTAGNAIDTIRRSTGLGLINPNSYFALGNILIGMSMIDFDKGSFMARDFTAVAFGIPLSIACYKTIQNVGTQLKENLPYPPSEGKPLALFATTILSAALVNAGFETSDALEITDILGDRDTMKEWCDRLTIAAQGLISIAYFQFSMAFEQLHIPLISKKPEAPEPETFDI